MMSVEVGSITSELWLEIDKLHVKYLDSKNTKLNKRKVLEDLVADYLSIVPKQRRFVSAATGDIIYNPAKWKPDFNLLEVADIFCAIENLAVKLLDPSWRKRLPTISKISPETTLFEQMYLDMGYRPTPGQAQVLSLELPVNIDKVTSVARDCLLAFVECQLLAEVHNAVSAQFPTVLEEVIDFRRDHIGSVDICIHEVVNLKQGAAMRAEELTGLRNRIKKVQRSNNNNDIEDQWKHLFGNYLKQSIQEKESEIECPVCVGKADVPIYRCSKEHLICSSCRSMVSVCPQCRVRYQGPPERYRYAERTVEEIKRLKQQLAEIEKENP